MAQRKPSLVSQELSDQFDVLPPLEDLLGPRVMLRDVGNLNIDEVIDHVRVFGTCDFGALIEGVHDFLFHQWVDMLKERNRYPVTLISGNPGEPIHQEPYRLSPIYHGNIIDVKNYESKQQERIRGIVQIQGNESKHYLIRIDMNPTRNRNVAEQVGLVRQLLGNNDSDKYSVLATYTHDEAQRLANTPYKDCSPQNILRDPENLVLIYNARSKGSKGIRNLAEEIMRTAA